MGSIVKRALRRLRTPRLPALDSQFEYLLKIPRYEEITVEVLGEPFRIADSASFYWSYKEIFLDRVYEFKPTRPHPKILDCGANYGTSIVFFKHKYPSSHIVAVEADPIIFRILEWNIGRRNLKDVTLLNKAISNHKEAVQFFHEGADAGRIHPLEGARGQCWVDPVKLDQLLEGRVDFLKMDIEGSETEAICSSQNLNNASQIFIEYHSFRDVDQSLHLILEKLSDLGFRYFLRTQFCPPRPFIDDTCQSGMDLQVNIFAKKSV